MPKKTNRRYQARNTTLEPIPSFAVCDTSNGVDIAFFTFERHRLLFLAALNAPKPSKVQLDGDGQPILYP